MSAASRYIAMVVYYNPHTNYALLEPLCRAPQWEKINEVETEFPNRGRISWFHPQPVPVKDSLWLVSRKPSPSFDEANANHDEYQVEAGSLLIDVIECVADNGKVDLEQMRSRVSGSGLSLPFTPTSPAWLRVDEQTICGPLWLVANHDGWRADPAKLEQYKIELRTIAADSIIPVETAAGRRWVRNLLADEGTVRGELDWASDEVVLKRLLKWARREDADGATLLQQAIEHITPLIRQKEPDAALPDWLQRIQRLLTMLESHHSLRQNLLDELQSLPFVRSHLEEVAERERQRVRAEMDKQLQAAQSRVAELQADAAQLQREKARLERENAGLQRQTDEHHATLQDMIAQTNTALEEAFSEKLEELFVRPEKELANLAVFRAALRASTPSPLATTAEPSGHHSPAQQPAWKFSTEGTVQTLDTPATLFSAWQREYQNELPFLQSLHAAFLTDAMPVLAGGRAYDLLRRYAECVTGGRLLWVPITMAIQEPADLLARYDVHTRRLIPHPAGLLDAWLQAQRSDELILVVLDGINRAPLDAYLLPLLATYQERWQTADGSRRKLPLAHPAELAPTDVYAAAARLAWPRNLLLAGIWLEHTLAPAPAPALWEQTVFLKPARFDFLVSRTAQMETETMRAQVLWQTWQAWREEAMDKALSLEEEAQRVGAVLSSASVELPSANWLQFYQALSRQDGVVERPLLTATLCCALPRLCSLGLGDQLVKAWQKEEEKNLLLERGRYFSRIVA
jgi:hypothetical protein